MCGTHVSNTANIGSFFNLKREVKSVRGVRRIEAICGSAAICLCSKFRAELEAIKESVKHKEHTDWYQPFIKKRSKRLKLKLNR